MRSLAERMDSDCCGTTCSKMDICEAIEALEKANAVMRDECGAEQRLGEATCNRITAALAATA